MPALLRPSGRDDGFTPSPRSQPPGPCGLWWVFYGDQFSLANFPRADSAAEMALPLGQQGSVTPY
jgi:hypothetical protein